MDCSKKIEYLYCEILIDNIFFLNKMYICWRKQELFKSYLIKSV